MPLSKQEQDELDALELAELEHKERGGANEPLPEEGLSGGSVRPSAGGALSTISDLISPSFTKAAGNQAMDRMAFGNGSQSMKDAANENQAGKAVGSGAAIALQGAGGGAMSGLAKTAGKRILANSAVSGAQGLMEKPEGEDGAGARFKQGALSALFGGLFSTGAEGIANLLGKGARVASNIKDVKSGEMANRAAAAIDDAARGINEKQIEPRSDQLEQLVRGNTYEVNPDRVKPVFPRLGNKMSEGLAAEASPQGMSIAGGQEAAAPARVELSGNRALRLKRAADSAAEYGASKPFDPVASASGEDAKALADILRNQINADPAASGLNEEMGKYASLRDALTSREGASPIETLTAKPGTSRGSVVDLADTAAGSKLRSLGDQIGTAKGLLLDPSKLAHPMQAPGELLRSGGRAAVEAASLADALSKKSPIDRNTIIQALTPTGGVK